MPDPKDPTPVEVKQEGEGWFVFAADGSKLPGQGTGQTEGAARELAGRVNSTWAGAKKERRGKGAPEITEAREERVARRADRFRELLG